MSCCDTPRRILNTITGDQNLLVAVTVAITQNQTVMQALAAALVSSDPNNTIRLGTDGLLLEDDSNI